MGREIINMQKLQQITSAKLMTLIFQLAVATFAISLDLDQTHQNGLNAISLRLMVILKFFLEKVNS